MSVTAKDVKDTFSEFAGHSDQLVDRWRLQAERRINLTQWGEKADDAILWLTAHLLKIEKQLRCGNGNAASGAVRSKRVGDLAVTYAVPTKMADTFLAATAYGQQYIDLKTGIWPTRVLGATD